MSAKHKQVAPKVSAQKPAKPVHTQPAATHSSQQHQPGASANYDLVSPSGVHSAIGKYPGEHEEHLNQFINHHNKAMEYKAKGDKTGAAVQFRARNHALVRYQQTAPKAHLKHLKADKVQQMMSIKE